MKVEHNSTSLYSQFRFIPTVIMSHYVSQQGDWNISVCGVRLVCEHSGLICNMEFYEIHPS